MFPFYFFKASNEVIHTCLSQRNLTHHSPLEDLDKSYDGSEDKNPNLQGFFLILGYINGNFATHFTE